MMMISILLSFKGSAHEKPTASASVAFFFSVSSRSSVRTKTLIKHSICSFLARLLTAYRGSTCRRYYHYMLEQRGLRSVSPAIGSG